MVEKFPMQQAAPPREEVQGQAASLRQIPAVLENSNVAQLASALYLLVHSLPQEDRYDTDDASARELYPMLVPQSTLSMVQSSR
jgi:hypothetical protein